MNTSITKALAKEFKKYKTEQTPQEFKWLLEKFTDINPQRILEIGSKYGGVTKFFYDFMGIKSRLYTIDIQERQWTWKKEYKPGKILVKIHGDSAHISTIQKLSTMLDGDKLDFIFINGSNDYNVIKSDFYTYFNLTTTGSIIALSNLYRYTENDSVTRLWYELKCQFRTDEYWYRDNLKATGIGVIYV